MLMSSGAGLAQTIGKTYTYEAIDRQIEGTVQVSYVLDRQGRIIPDSTRVLQGLGYGLDALAVQAVNYPASLAVTPANQALARRSEQPARFNAPVVFALKNLTPRDWSDYYVLKGDKALAEANPARAISYYDLALGRYKKNGQACAGLAKAYTNQGKSDQAAKYAELANKYSMAAR
ncbi:energy transducer TonB [Hymenobacter sp. 15J16-1T3B]|uniref:energy transducer TonB n=1 Tax=Hymenobacter sp. 15J16-1T3B TaxID=2886941 RepID=UPI001D10D2EB|nr:energy transducer TonB [Hymenobacter sp. 15J16-1T3B]MCC3160104.1 energy transducer TonB [Hymenobacter sp. 15J16-1T3B]